MISTTSKQDKDFATMVVASDAIQSAIEFITYNFKPEEIYSEGDLIRWAEENGYQKGGE